MTKNTQKTEAWIDNLVEEKARELIDKIDDVYPALRSITYWENFILNLLNEAPKPKVGREFVEKWKETVVFCAFQEVSPHIKQMLEEAGVEVEE